MLARNDGPPYEAWRGRKTVPAIEPLRALVASQLRINIASGLGNAILDAVMTVAAYGVYIHFLGYTTYGVWALLGTLVSFAQLGTIGIIPAVVKGVAADYGRGDLDSIKETASSGFLVLLTSGSCLVVVATALRRQIFGLLRISSQAHTDLATSLVPYVALLSAYAFIVELNTGILAGLGRLDIVNCSRTAARTVAVLVSVSLLYLNVGVASIVIGNLAYYLVLHGWVSRGVRKAVGASVFGFKSWTANRCAALVRFGGTLLIGSVVQMLVTPLNKIALARFVGLAGTSMYDVAFSGSMKIRSVVDSGLRALLPEFSRMSARSGSAGLDRLRRLFLRSYRALVLISVPAYLLLSILLEVLLSLWLGELKGRELVGIFRVMLWASFASLLDVPSYYLAIAVGRATACFTSSLILGSVNVFMLGAILNAQGRVTTMGASYAVLVATIGSTAYLVLRAVHVMGSLERRATPTCEAETAGAEAPGAASQGTGHAVSQSAKS